MSVKSIRSIATTTLENDFRNFINERLGIVIQDRELEKMQEVILAACTQFNFADGEAYLRALRIVSINAPEFEFLISGITIGETYFFRDNNQFEFLRHTWLPECLTSAPMEQTSGIA
jgi:chemotaxis protein methyltransferase CheR